MQQGDSPRISGAIVVNHLAELRRRDAPAVTAALATLQPEARAEVADALAMGWVDIDAYAAFYEAVAHRMGRPVEGLHTEVSRISVERTLTTVHRVFMRLTTDSALVSRTPKIYSRTFDRGTLVPTITSPGHAHIQVSGWQGMPQIALRGLRIGVETVLQVAGRKDVHVHGARTREGAQLTATWSAR